MKFLRGHEKPTKDVDSPKQIQLKPSFTQAQPRNKKPKANREPKNTANLLKLNIAHKNTGLDADPTHANARYNNIIPVYY